MIMGEPGGGNEAADGAPAVTAPGRTGPTPMRTGVFGAIASIGRTALRLHNIFYYTFAPLLLFTIIFILITPLHERIHTIKL